MFKTNNNTTFCFELAITLEKTKKFAYHNIPIVKDAGIWYNCFMEWLKNIREKIGSNFLRPRHLHQPWTEPTLSTSIPLSRTAELVLRAADIEMAILGLRSRNPENLLAALSPNQVTGVDRYELAKLSGQVLAYFGITRSHVLLGINALIGAQDVSDSYLRDRTQTAKDYFEGVRPAGLQDVQVIPQLRKVLDSAESSAIMRGAKTIDDLDLLNGVLQQRETIAVGILEHFGVNMQLMQEAISAARNPETWEDFVIRVSPTSPPQESVDNFRQSVSTQRFTRVDLKRLLG